MDSMKYYDVQSCMQVIGDIFQNLNLLDLEEKYKFNEADFAQEFHRILFGTIYNLHELGAKQVTIEDIERYLEQRPKLYAVYKVNKGAEYLANLQEMCQIATFDYYYNRMKKMTLLRMYSKTLNMDLSWLYDPDNILDVKKKEVQETWFDNTSLQEIANLISDKIDEIKSKYLDNSEDGVIQAGNGALSLLERLKETPEIGYPLYGKLVNAIHRGARLKKFYLRSAATGIGKAITVNTILPTPAGQKKAGDIKIGDYLFDALGRPTKVLGVYPQGKKEVWELTLKDGRTAKCSKDHLWSYYSHDITNLEQEKRKFRTETLEYINTFKLSSMKKNGKSSFDRFFLPMQEAVQYEPKKYKIDPYTFGLILGTGIFEFKRNQKIFYCKGEDKRIIQEIAKRLDVYYKESLEFSDYWSFEWKIDKIKKSHRNVWIQEILEEFPELWGLSNDKKFIPRVYLEGSIDQRYNLLAGLVDSIYGEYNSESGIISFKTISDKLMTDVIELVSSLGHMFEYELLFQKENEKRFHYISFKMGYEDREKFFKSEKNALANEKWKTKNKYTILNGAGTQFRNLKRIAITKIENLGYEEDMVCFMVDNDEHLFLMNDFIVTHNTRTMIADACNIACDQIYNPKTKEWENNGTKEPTQFITTEQEEDEIQTMMIAFLSGVNEDHILENTYVGDEWDRVVKAAHILEKSPLYIKKLPDFSLQDIENAIKFGIRQYGAKYIFMDYIHSSMKILSEISSKAGVKGLREDNILFMIGVRLKDLCNQYGVFIMSSTQLNGQYQTAEQYDQNLLRGAKSLGDKIDVGMILLQVDQDDKEALKDIISNSGIEMPDIKMSIYKNRRGRYKDILLWCKSDRGTCRIDPLFATTYNYELVDIKDLKINVTPRIESSAF